MIRLTLCATTRPTPSANLLHTPRIDGWILPTFQINAPKKHGAAIGIGGVLAPQSDSRMPHGYSLRGGVVGAASYPQPVGFGSAEADLDWLVQYHERGVSRPRIKA